jgi:hypothetical protein
VAEYFADLKKIFRRNFRKFRLLGAAVKKKKIHFENLSFADSFITA